MDVLLIDMPFGHSSRPSLALSLLKPLVESRGVRCEISYANLRFAALLGLDDYDYIANGMHESSLAGEWVFGEALFGSDAVPLDRFGPHLVTRCGESPEVLHLLRRARQLASAFVGDYVGAVPWEGYGIVGFTSCCHQNVASLAVARRIKAARPDIVTVFGGPNWDDDMGVCQLEQFDFVDYACQGESDLSFPDLVWRLTSGQSIGETPLPGVARRVGRGVAVDEGSSEPQDLDELPLPDYSDYFEALRETGLAGRVSATVNVELSRGCWWTKTGPCRFCGQNRTSQRYRSKSPSRARRELGAAARLCPKGVLELTDNVAPPYLVRVGLPEVAEALGHGRLFFEARPTLRREEVALIGAWGFLVQIGVESLSDHVLSLLRKGTGALENIRLLKWCRTFGVNPTWNLLYGVPGETPDDVRETLDLLPSLAFLPPPRACHAITLDRFSTYFEAPEVYGFRNPRAPTAYGCVYPLEEDFLHRVAHSHAFERDEDPALAAYHFRLCSAASKWPKRDAGGELRLTVTRNGPAAIEDSRPCSTKALHVLDDVSELIVGAADEICTRAELETAARGAAVIASTSEIDERLSELIERRLLVEMDDRYLSLAMSPHEDAARFSRACVAAVTPRARDGRQAS